ncbi:MAG: hypothetical protein AAB466_06815 [Verrucomicrobiota bacterium]
MSAGTATPRTPVDLSECSEGDVVEFFKAGLRAFIANDGGSCGARAVTLRQERTYPSDQDFALLFSAEGVFEVHLFGLQFKRWEQEGWRLSSRQQDALQRMAHVVAYCFPRPVKGTPRNALHAFVFVNPARVGALQLGFLRHSNLRLDSRSIGQRVQKNVVQRVVSLSGAASRQLLPPWQRKAALRKVLDEALTGIADVVAEVINDESLASLFDADRTWGANAIRPEGGAATVVPYVSWGEFFEDVLLGATFITVNGSPNGPPTPDVFPGGIGLRLLGAGSHATAWAQRELADHVALWARTVLEPPAAVIAYESFSRALQLIEISP